MSLASDIADQSALDNYLAIVLRRAADQSRSLTQLARRGRGAYPTEVRRIVSDLVDGSGATLPDSLLAYEPIDCPDLAVSRSLLPVPHPLDFEWRFSEAASLDLARRLEAAAPSWSASIGLIGSPSLAELLPGLSNAHVVLFERRAEACGPIAGLGLVEVIEGDVRTAAAMHANRFDVLLGDPPWYPAATEGFLQAAARLIGPGGALLLSVPSIATRPGLVAERRDIVAIAASLGFVLEGLEQAAIEYESPPFERAALDAAGLPAFDPFWRRGDLLTFVKVPTHPSSNRQLDLGRLPVSGWDEVRIGPARIRVSGLISGGRAGRLDSVVEGDILDSVSARDPRRESVNVWTTTNRVFRTSDPPGLLHALNTFADSGIVDPDWSVDLERLVAAELVLLARFGVE